MKRIIRYAFLTCLVEVISTGCTVWEDKCTECIPLPGIETPIVPAPWDPNVAQDSESGS